ncbi:hypothetical protein JCM33374_g256 [Metschnikowia sp. JCM 33374]|nr:hypothetical protein JCM33374_g256 [Metschnikowia sp. JCM 33374]
MTRHSKSKSGLVDSSKFTVAPDHTNTTKRTTCDIESTTKTHNDTNTASCFSALATGSSVDSTTLGASTKASPNALTGTTTQKHKTRKSSKRSKKTKKAKVEKIANDEGQKRPTSTVLKKVVGISTSTAPVPASQVSFVDTKKETTKKAPTERAHVKQSQHEGLAALTKPSNTADATSGLAAPNQALQGAQTEAPGSIPSKATTKPYSNVFQEVASTSPLEQKAKSQSLSYAEVARKAMEKTAVGAHKGTKVKVPTRGTRSPSGQDEGCSRNHERSMTSKRQHEIDADGFQLVRARRYRPSTKVPVRSAWERYCKRKNGNKNGDHYRRSRPADDAVGETVGETVQKTVPGTFVEAASPILRGIFGAIVAESPREDVEEPVEGIVGDEIRTEADAASVSYAYLMTFEATFTEGVLTKVIVREAIVRETIAAERISKDLFFRETIATRRVASESRISEVFGPDLSVPAIMTPGISSPGEVGFEKVDSGDVDSEEVFAGESASEYMPLVEGVLETMSSGIASGSTEPDNIPAYTLPPDIIRCDTMGSDTMVSDTVPKICIEAPATTNGQMWFATKLALAFMMLSAARDIFQVLFLVWQFAESI